MTEPTLSTHETHVNPVEDCPYCRYERRVPVQQRHGMGAGSLVVPIVLLPEENTE